MNTDRFKFRAWIEIPLTQDDGEEFDFNLCLYGIDVLSGGNLAGFDECLLADILSETKLTDKQKDEVWRFCADNNIFNSETYYCIPIDKIEQCTGLNDQSGKLIFEGDIVNICGVDIGVVDWDKSQYQIIRCQLKLPISVKYVPIRNIDTQAVVEVIGNVNQNKNLLQAKDGSKEE